MKNSLRTLIWLWLGLYGISAVAKEQLTVLTAYPEDVVSRFETAFEREQPDIDLIVLWRMPHDALPYLKQANQGGVDVYWSAALGNFMALKQQDGWQKLSMDRKGLPDRLGAMPLRDPDGYFCATEMAGYGFAINPAYLQKHGLPTPKTWRDLADARYQGHLALPVPSKVGFAPMMIDSVLRQYGWEQGWAILAGIVANASLVESGATFIGDILGSGERGIGPSIDFFTASAIANGAPLQFVYSQPTAYSPAQIGITRTSRHADAAKRFVAFVLSEAGQKTLFHPDIRKLPVRASVYAEKPTGYYDPFASTLRQPVVYDPNTALPRLAVQNALFDQLFSDRLPRMQTLWRRLRVQEQRGSATKTSRLEKAHRLLSAVPIDAAQANKPEWQRLFIDRKHDAAAEASAQGLEQAWHLDIDSRYDEVEVLLRELES